MEEKAPSMEEVQNKNGLTIFQDVCVTFCVYISPQQMWKRPLDCKRLTFVCFEILGFPTSRQERYAYQYSVISCVFLLSFDLWTGIVLQLLVLRFANIKLGQNVIAIVNINSVKRPTEQLCCSMLLSVFDTIWQVKIT